MTLAITTASLLSPTVANAEPAPAQPEPHHDVTGDVTTRVELRADRDVRTLEPRLKPAGALREVAAVAVAVAPPLPPVPVAPAVPVSTYRPKHAKTVNAAHYTKAGNTGSTHYAPVSASGRAQAAIAYALAQIGDPYVYGATGPSSFDCSGLVQAAFRAAGVSLPRTAAQISNRGVAVPDGQWQPGDVLYWGTRGSAYHVAIYLGGGQIVEAAHPGTDVRRGSVWGKPRAIRL